MADLTPASPLPPQTPQPQPNVTIPSSTPNTINTSSLLSPADCFRLGQITSMLQSSPIPLSQPSFPPAPVMKKKRGRPPKPKPTVTKESASASQLSSLPPPNDLDQADITLSPSTQATTSTQPTESTKLCWFTPREDGKCNMDIAASWCSVFANFNDWRTNPKTLVGEKLALYLVSKNHPKREGRECQKKVRLF